MDQTMAITAKDVAALRERNGAGMMDCKKALEETGGDLDKLAELLPSKGAVYGETPSPRRQRQSARRVPVVRRRKGSSAATSTTTARSPCWPKSIARPFSSRAPTI